MDLEIVPFIQGLSSQNYLISVLILGLSLPTFLLWRGLKKGKDLSFYRQEHVFDFVFFSLLFGVLVSRFFYIILNLNDFSEIRWFWIPYEKIEDQVLWFETFPWVFFKMGVNTVLWEGFALGFLGGIFSARSIHRLPWKKISMALCDFVGITMAFGCWVGYIYTKQEILVYPILTLFIFFLTKELTVSSFDLFKKLTAGIWKFSSALSISFVILLSVIIRGVEEYVNGYGVIVVLVVLVNLYFAFNVLYVRKKTAVRIPFSTERKIIPTRPQRRSYTLSYRTLSGKWWNKLISKFHSGSDADKNEK